MQVTLLRHATAQPFGTTDSDFSRKLIEKGFEQCKRVAFFCQRNQIKPDTLLTSPYPRALQTATELVKCLRDYPTPQTVDWLIPGSGNQSILSGLNALSDLQSVMLVLHEPDISALLGKLMKT